MKKANEVLIDDLVAELARPVYVLRMARPLEDTKKSARTRAKNARQEILDILIRYAEAVKW